MPTHPAIEWYRPHSVPLVMIAIVAVTAIVIPPLVLGELSARTYALTAPVLILAIGSVFSYAVLVAFGALQLLYAGIASYAAPQESSDDPHSFSASAALRHVVAGVTYVFVATAVGAVGIGVQMTISSDFTLMPTKLQPSFLLLGGALAAGTFVSLQLWRYDQKANLLALSTILRTTALGVLLALAPVVAYRIFSGTGL